MRDLEKSNEVKWHLQTILNAVESYETERENKRPVITDVSKPVILWNVWVYYQKDIIRKAEAEKGGGYPAGKRADSDDD